MELLLEQLLVGHRLAGVEHHQDQRARAGGPDDSLPSALAVLGALDDAGEVQQLDLGALVSCGAKDGVRAQHGSQRLCSWNWKCGVRERHSLMIPGMQVKVCKEKNKHCSK